MASDHAATPPGMLSGVRPALLIAARDLRAASFLGMPVLVRTAATAALVVALGFAVGVRGLFAAPGQAVLAWFGHVNWVLAAVCGITWFPALALRERDGTGTLLRLAGVGPIAFLVGQSCAALVALILVLLVQVPFLWLAIALGGTNADAIVATVAVLGAYTAAVYALALAASARAPSTLHATVQAALLVFSLTFGPDALERILPPTTWISSLGRLQVPVLLAYLRTGAIGEVVPGIVRHVAIAVGAIAWAVVRFSLDGGVPERARRRSLRPVRARFARGSGAISMLGRRVATGGVGTWVTLVAVFGVVHASRPRGLNAVPTGLLIGLAVTLATPLIAARSLTVHLDAGVVPLLGLTGRSPISWLRAVRRARWSTTGLCLLGFAATWSTMPLREGGLEFGLMVAGAVALGDAVGERYALRRGRAPGAAGVLTMVGIVAAMVGLAYVVTPQSGEVYFMFHAATYATLAAFLWHGSHRRARELNAVAHR